MQTGLSGFAPSPRKILGKERSSGTNDTPRVTIDGENAKKSD